MGSPYFTTGPVAPATDPTPGASADTGTGAGANANRKPPYAAPAAAGDGGPVPPFPLLPPGRPTTRLDTPYELTASAGAARQIAADLDSANTKAGPGAHSLTEYASTAATKVRGFSFGDALTGSTERWLQQCKALHGKVDAAATGLDRTRAYYHGNEITTVADLRAAR
ncbi:hypothetical protein AB0O91_26360 [Kitasatospora sp. NPDC089797]|uniref:hypothetical protein n=1 Tax=Kitasatospora sp. NPDC089797 TaxID=3155298 RepID=UPI00343A540F